jgi:hypothetical protein
MTDDKMKSIAEYARTLPNPIFAIDVQELVTVGERQAAELCAWRRWAEENWYAGVAFDGTDEELRSLACAIMDERG